MEAKICPDGSAVGRVPPTCAFAPCPGESTSSASSVIFHSYQDSGIGYSISVPSGWTTVESKEVVTENYQATGTAFIAPEETGTTLGEAFFHVAQVTSCPSFTESTSVTIAGVAFQRALWSGVGAGNLYEGVTYAGSKDAGCFVLTGYLHSCNLGSDCGPGRSAQFDKEKFFSLFETMAKSVEFLVHPGD